MDGEERKEGNRETGAETGDEEVTGEQKEKEQNQRGRGEERQRERGRGRRGEQREGQRDRGRGKGRDSPGERTRTCTVPGTRLTPDLSLRREELGLCNPSPVRGVGGGDRSPCPWMYGPGVERGRGTGVVEGPDRRTSMPYSVRGPQVWSVDSLGTGCPPDRTTKTS